MNRNCSWAVSAILAVAVAGCAGTGAQLSTHPSPHFERVSRQLDLGGVVYLYLDLQGDIQALVQGIQQWLEAIPDLKVDLPRLVDALGLNAVTAVGLSSVKDGALFHNKAFLYHRGNRKGLLQISGTAPHDFEIPRLAPADADWAYEHDLNAKSVFNSLEPLITEMTGPQALSALDERIPGLDLSWRKLIEMLDTRLYGFLRLDPDRSTPVPGSEYTVPRIDLLLAVDSLGPLFDAVRTALARLPMVRTSEDDRLEFLEFALPMPAGFDWFAPVAAKDKKSGRVLLATHRDLVHGFAEEKNALVKSESFRQATAGLPLRGNGLIYASAEIAAKIRRTVESFPASGTEERRIVRAICNLFLPAEGIPTASVTTQLPDGLYTVSNTTSSHKETIFLAEYLNPMVLGVVSAVAIPAFIRYRDRAAAAAKTAGQN